MKSGLLLKAKNLAYKLGTLFANTLTTSAVDNHKYQQHRTW
ncbi:MAG: hypothetical protein ACK5NK_13960 [Niabella sp.]